MTFAEHLMFSIPYKRLQMLITLSSAAALLCCLGCQSSPEATDEPEPAPNETEGPVFEEPEERNPEESQPTKEQREEAGRVSDEDLEMFAAGVRALAERERELVEAGMDYETRRREASGPVEVREIEEETILQMQDALQEGAGVDFEAFMLMGQVIQQNPILMDRLSEHLDEEEITDFYGE